LRVTIHQPEHLPWLGFLSKIDAADLWIVLDSVAYRKNYFQNRNQVRSGAARTWLTVPVGTPSATHIRDVRISDAPNWQRKYVGRLVHAYPAAHAAGELTPGIELTESAGAGDRLLDLNLALADWLFAAFGVTTPRVLASELDVPGHKSELIRNLCLAVAADSYIAGPSGRDYLDLEDFAGHGVDVGFFDYHHPTYDQGVEFVSHLSAVDAVASVAPAELRDLLLDWDVTEK
jgi:hypothetical protein